MSPAPQLAPVSVEDYLRTELDSTVKHEYVGGAIYAMSGGRNRHNQIASNILGSLWGRLRGKSCRVYNSDTKVRVRLPSHVRFYYPDVQVVCRPNSPDEGFQDEPAMVIEVISRSTRRIDEGEKRDAYLTIPGLDVYLLVEGSTPAVVAFRRTDQGFVREVYEGVEANVPLPEMGIELPLAEIYEAVVFKPPKRRR